MSNELLNENERAVLKAMYQNIIEETAGDFGYIEDVDRCGLSEQQFGGYVSALTKKGMIGSPVQDFHGQFHPTRKGVEALNLDVKKFDV